MQEHHPLIGKAIAIQSASPLHVRVAADCARFSLRIEPAQADQAAKAFGSALPDRIGGVVSTSGRLAVRLGPDEWYLFAPLEDQQAIQQAFAGIYPTVPHSLVDVGHREVGLEVEGLSAQLALRSAIAFDIEAMRDGTGCRTIFDKVQIILIRHSETRFRIEVWRSFADQVWGILEAAGREIALDI